MTERFRKDVSAIIRDGTAIDRAIERAQRRVKRRHRLLGIPLVIWQDGRVVEIRPQDIPRYEEPDDGQP